MSEKVHNCKIKREKGYLYFVDAKGNVARFLQGQKEKEIICPNNGEFQKEVGWMYFVDKDGDVSRARMKSFREFAEVSDEIGEEFNENWIAKAVKQHSGRCTPAPNPDCPKGSPQYNLAMRFKHGDLHKK